MKKTSSFGWLAIIMLSLPFFSCERAPEFSDTPKIDFEKVVFGESAVQDSLRITISFEDGDGDLGISLEEASDYPFHVQTYFLADPPYSPVYNITGISPDKLLQYGDLDTLPAYNCIDYVTLAQVVDNQTKLDTVYVKPNPRNKNFVLKFFIKKGENFEEFDFLKETCIPSSGRFTRLNTSENDRPLQGTLSYSFRARNMRQYFDGNVLKLQIYIVDRGEHKSNVVESPEFTLDDILLQ